MFVKEERGFTLVEMAIVLIIIGILVGGILKGMAMVQEAKVKRIVKSADELRAAVMTFYDKYGMYPGDENSNNFPPGDHHRGNGDGQISYGEADMLFEDLVNAGIISGNYDGAGEDSIPNHAFGDKYRLYWTNPGGGAQTNHWIRYENLPWDVCLEIDTKYDDGVYNSGSIRANEDYTEGNSPIAYFYVLF